MNATGIDPRSIGYELRIGRVTRENSETRALRLLLEGRVAIRSVGLRGVLAFVKGDSGSLRTVRFDPGLEWQCSCPARGKCAHVRAVMHVVTVTDNREDPGGYGGTQ